MEQTHEYVTITYNKKDNFARKIQPVIEQGWRIVQISDHFILFERPIDRITCPHCHEII